MIQYGEDFDVIGSVIFGRLHFWRHWFNIAKIFFQIWWTAAGYGKLCVWFKPIRNGKIFWMNNKSQYWIIILANFRLLSHLQLIRSSTARGSVTSISSRWSLQILTSTMICRAALYSLLLFGIYNTYNLLFLCLLSLKVEEDHALLQHWVLNFFELVSLVAVMNS